jgi:hypothetical protein
MYEMGEWLLHLFFRDIIPLSELLTEELLEEIGSLLGERQLGVIWEHLLLVQQIERLDDFSLLAKPWKQMQGLHIGMWRA